MSQKPVFYGLLTVRLPNAPDSDEKAFAQIKDLLGIKAPLLDEEMGIFPSHIVPAFVEPNDPSERVFVIGVEHQTLFALIKAGHPNIVGCMHAMGYPSTGRPDYSAPEYKNLPQNKGPKP